MTEPKEYLGKRITFLGHKLKVVKVVERELGYSKLSLSCAVHCCTSPCQMTMEMTLHDFKVLCKCVEVAEELDRLLQKGERL